MKIKFEKNKKTNKEKAHLIIFDNRSPKKDKENFIKIFLFKKLRKANGCTYLLYLL